MTARTPEWEAGRLAGYEQGIADLVLAVMETKHLPDRERGGCECGFCAWSVDHVVIMANRELERPSSGDPAGTETCGHTEHEWSPIGHMGLVCREDAGERWEPCPETSGDGTRGAGTPSTDELLGIDPRWTGGVSVEDYLGKARRRESNAPKDGAP